MANTIIKVNCINQEVTFADNPLVASGGENEDVLEISFCELWDGYAKICVFYQNPNRYYYALVDENNKCVIPHEVLQNEGILFFGIFGCNHDGITRTSQIARYMVEKGAISSTITPAEPTQDIYQQILSELEEIRLTANQLNNEWNDYKLEVPIIAENKATETVNAKLSKLIVISNEMPTDKPCLWFNTANGTSTQMLDLSSNESDSNVQLETNNQTYAVNNANLDEEPTADTYGIDTK